MELLNNINAETAKKMIETLKGAYDSTSFNDMEVDYSFPCIYWVNGKDFYDVLIDNYRWEDFVEDYYYLDEMDMIFLFTWDSSNILELKNFIELQGAKAIRYEILVKSKDCENGIIKEAFYIPSTELILVGKSYYIGKRDEDVCYAVGAYLGVEPSEIKLISKTPMQCCSLLF